MIYLALTFIVLALVSTLILDMIKRVKTRVALDECREYIRNRHFETYGDGSVDGTTYTSPRDFVRKFSSSSLEVLINTFVED